MDFVGRQSARTELLKLPNGFISEFSLKPDAAHWLYELVFAMEGRTVIELGCGLSTVMMALVARQRPVRILSLEHDECWLVQTERALNALNLNGLVELIHAPLTPIEFEGRTYQAHDDHAVKGVQASLLLVDAPPESIGRLGTLVRMRAHLHSAARVVLDDAWRPSEEECIRIWTRQGLARLDGYVNIGAGLAVLEVV